VTGLRSAVRFAALGACLLAGTAMAAPPQVTVAAGALRGIDKDGVEQFLGVPFAAPPVGDLRWRAPQPASPWSGVRPAVAFGADCMQWPMDAPPAPAAAYVRPTSEDCLTLNVWRPHATGAKKLPVMVWIYGGAFAMGSASWPVYSGANMASQGVIYVAANYRLARFGWFAHPALTAADGDHGQLANYGMMDQIAALKWVRDNIAAFGGDPDNVTVMGESAGAVSVFALLASPAAKGLFARAIAQSGHAQGGIGAMQDAGLAAAEAKGAAWTRSLGIADTDLAAMRALPAATVLGPKNPLVLGGLIIDGKLLPKPIDRAFLDGAVARVPVIVGSNSWEASLLKYLPGAEKAVPAAMGARGAALLALYRENGRVPEDAALKALWGDAFMTASARYVARRVAAGSAPAYLYRYSYVPIAERGKVPGARHSAEISLVLRNQLTGAQFGENAADTPMAETMSGYWLRFAKTGNPNLPGAPVTWPRYTPTSDRLIEFSNEGAKVREGLDKARFDLIDAAFLERQGLTSEPKP
jgi:para-nitrobenzyl esterase